LKSILGKLGGGQDKLNQAEEMKQQAKAYDFNPNNVAPPEVQKQLLDLLKWHDDILRSVIEKIEMIPGLSNLMDEFSNTLNECMCVGH
jgi:ribosomal protein S6